MNKPNIDTVDADRLKRRSRLLTREEAAAYCRLSPQGFSRWVKMGRMPGPIASTARWDLRAIDAALDSLSGIADQDSLANYYSKNRPEIRSGRLFSRFLVQRKGVSGSELYQSLQ
jgi:hypothetical protein